MKIYFFCVMKYGAICNLLDRYSCLKIERYMQNGFQDKYFFYALNFLFYSNYISFYKSTIDK